MNKHISFVKQQPCILCLVKYNKKVFDYDPDFGECTDAHHLTIRTSLDNDKEILRGFYKVSDKECIPLCKNHHQGKQGIHTLGRKAWEKKFNVTQEFLYYVFCKLHDLEYVDKT